jgi:hypothetical protein
VAQGSKKSDMSATTLGGADERAFGDDVATQLFGSQISSLTPTRSWPTEWLQARFRRDDSVCRKNLIAGDRSPFATVPKNLLLQHCGKKSKKIAGVSER